ncbi:MAG: radical SAM protein [Candidatus Sabulitectum sp.]|nr:radical SAM protein [Candidatus Sabulitectum sp.]
MPPVNRVPKHSIHPASADISITGKCNLKCRYCFYSDEMVALNDLTTQQWKQSIKKLGDAKIMRVTLTGGEPFTRPDFFELVDSVIENRMRYSILTNGTLITEETIKEFSKDKRRLRLDSIQISIDGSKAEVHNKSRPDSFDRAVRALKLLKENKFPLTVRATISRHNMNDVEDMAAFLLEDIGLPSMTNNEASPIGTGCTYKDEVALDHKEILEVGKRLEKLQQKYPGRITAQAGPLAKLRMYREMEDARKNDKLTNRWKMGYLSSCGGVFNKLGILHDGSIVPCSMLHALTMGNILKDDLLTTWDKSQVIQEVRDRYVVPMTEINECKNCKWVKYCNGGCPGIVQQMQNTILAPSWRGCYKNFLKANNINSVYDAYPQEEQQT